MQGGKRLYSTNDVSHLLDDGENEASKCLIYARVSSAHQKEDLKRQIEALRGEYPDHEVIEDVGSGINFKRPGFLKMMKMVCEGQVRQVVVAHKDRLCRFASDLVEWLLVPAQTTLVVASRATCDPEDDAASSQQELSDDLLSIVTVFEAKNNGRRAAENRRKRREKANQEETVGPC